MKRLAPAILAAIMLSACQQTPRNIIQIEVPDFSSPIMEDKAGAISTDENAPVTYQNIVITGPEALEWDVFDRTDAVMKYAKMPIKDKEQLFETVARVYAELPEGHELTCEKINIGIWNELQQKGVDLAFGNDPADWHPYLMYIHPLVIAEMTNFFLNAKEGSITDEELSIWQKAGCNLINAHPDALSMAAILTRKDDLTAAGIELTEDKDGFFTAKTQEINWADYRAKHNK